jgi:rhodanese-related sulfurtransferase
MQQPDRITAGEAIRRIDRREKLIFVDVRDSDSWSGSEELIGNAMRVPPSEIATYAARIPRTTLVVYCDSARQQTSMSVARDLIARGFRHVFVLEGGLDGWKQAKGRMAAKPTGADVHRPPAHLPDSPPVRTPNHLPEEGVAARGGPSTPMASIPSPHHRPSHA